jgi:glycosyltransferase involved in cell wall biosynthesis
MVEDRLAGRRIGLVGPLPPPSGGMANQTRQLADLLVKAGAEVSVVQVNAAYRPQWVARVPVLRALFRLLPYLLALWRVSGRSEILHVMANSGWSWHLFAAPAVWIGWLRGSAVVVNYRGGEAAKFLDGNHRLVRFTMRRAHVLIVPSRFLEEIFLSRGMPARIVPNIVDLEKFRVRTHAQFDAPKLLVARNLEPLYDNASAIRALKIIQEDFPKARLTIAGSGPQEAELRQLALEIGLAEQVLFTGRLEPKAMAEAYQSAELMVNPSLADNMPNSILEAWASGVPVVSTNVGGVPFMATDSVNVSLVAPGNPVEIAEASVALLKDRNLWRQRAAAGQAEAQRYTWEKVRPLLADVYSSALRRAR